MKTAAARLLSASLVLGFLTGSVVAQEVKKPVEPEKKEPAKPTAPPAPAEPVKSEPAKVEPAKTEPAKAPEAKPAPGKSTDKRFVLGHTMKSIDGKDVDLSTYQGKVILMVNVASKCGYTKQYDGLEKLFKEKGDKGFVVMGFPAKNFNGQEPGSDAEIAAFCKDKHSVTFPMFSKISVKGADQHPLFKMLAAQPAPVGGDPKWNFTKFLVDAQGNVVARFDSGVKPDDKELVAKIDELLKASAPK